MLFQLGSLSVAALAWRWRRVNLLDLVVLSAGPHFFVDYQSLISSPSTLLLVAHEGFVILWSTNSFVKAGH
jgi:hypothetical protein